MVDFSSLLRKPAGEAKRPPVLPAMDAPGIIKSWEMGESRTNKNAYVRFHVALTGWGETAPEEWSVFDGATGKTYQVQQSDVDLSKRSMRRDYFFTEDAQWRLDDFIRSCGIDLAGRSYDEIFPELIGLPVLVEVQQYTAQNTMEVGNQIGKLVGQGA